MSDLEQITSFNWSASQDCEIERGESREGEKTRIPLCWFLVGFPGIIIRTVSKNIPCSAR